MLIQKNISGVYSDDVFKEQNKIVEEKIKSIQIAKDDSLIKKYNLEAITNFVTEKLSDLVKTYTEADLNEKRVLMCSIYPSGLRWNGFGYSNTQINDCYSSILDLQGSSVPFGSADGIRTRDLLHEKQIS